MKRLAAALLLCSVLVSLAAVDALGRSRYGRLLDRARDSSRDEPWVFTAGVLRRPYRFYVRTRTSPRRQRVTLEWFITCERGRRTRETVRRVRRRGRSLTRIRPNLRRARECDVSLTVTQATPGRVAVRLYGRKRGE